MNVLDLALVDQLVPEVDQGAEPDQVRERATVAEAHHLEPLGWRQIIDVLVGLRAQVVIHRAAPE